MKFSRGAMPLAAVAVLAIVLAGCSGARSTQRTAMAQPEQLAPVQNSSVASTALPPIGSSGVTTGGIAQPAPIQANPALTGQPGQMSPALTGQPAPIQQNMGDPALQSANAGGTFVTLDAVGNVPQTPGRDLTGGLTVPKMLGGWTLVSGGTQCRLNLTQTAKEGTQRYRASTPGCQMPGISAVASWQLAGSQLQLYDEGGNIVATLVLSGSRFVGTGSGGIGLSMVG